ncbi:MAG: NAD-dependent epimerase/dehydratase family protein [Acidobacteriota bacterium]|nr:NAD-dependent epimerase/dehydratase family protein [Acidobacteriota bacterium]
MRVVVTGATGNIGTATIRALSTDRRVDSVVGVARRPPDQPGLPDVEWVRADVATGHLDPVFAGADVVVHLAWLFQPTRDPLTTWNANVLGSRRVFEAAARAGARALVYSSSVGAYSPGPKDRTVDETWPTDGWPEAAYTREKAYVERLLDAFELSHPDVRVVRLRPGFVFQKQAASQQRRLFAGPLIPGWLARPGVVPVIPDIPGLRVQVVHADDVGDAVRRAALDEASGPFNLAADPPVDPPVEAGLIAEILGARTLPVPARAARLAVGAAWAAHLAPATPGLFEAVLHLPSMDTGRARAGLGWVPRSSARDALEAFLSGLREGAGGPSEPLAADSLKGRLRELATGVGRRP